MITAQDIRNKLFKARRFGGYDIASVDAFLDELADDVAAYQEEIDSLRSQIKVLSEKAENPRTPEKETGYKI